MRLDLLREHEAEATKAATPVYFVADKDSLSESGAPERLVALARLNNFQGETGSVLAGEDGVLLGVGDGSDPYVAAAASERLPEGDYVFAAPMQRAEAEAAALGWLLGGYRFDRYKKQKPAVGRLVAPKGVDVGAVMRAAEATGLVRDLVNTPAGDMLPAKIEEEARQIADRFGADIDCIVGDDLLTRNFPMIHAVGRAAVAAPRLIDLTWGRRDAPKVTIVGKGVAFDSGGLNLKPASGMLLMKKDMGGAANALGLAQMIMDAGVGVRLRVLIPAVENAVSGSAYRPGDVLKSRKGITVEIGNTDAEGRLVLADALAYGGEEKPAMMITLATLTGAARVALGPDLAPFYTDDNSLAADIEEAGAALFDPVWRMPLWSNYDSMLSSSVADVNNSANGAFAGSITAALFLKRFAPPDVSWAHFDIFAWRPKAAPGRPVGGEAQAMRALERVIAKRFGPGTARG
ncbi:MAG: leucyl aminopeptidase family protein [Pseudomonadota bacterium]|nr:leucyl aminopeptidase family protein [Pseudomonadota bacterium]